MKTKIKNGIILIFVIITCILCVFKAIVNNNQPENNTVKCVVDSVWSTPQASVAETYPVYHFHTHCDITITSPTKNKEIGDTIKFSN